MKLLKKAIVCLTLLCLLLFTSLHYQVEQTSATVLDEFPISGETLIVDSDSILTISEGETVECAGELIIQPNEGSLEVEIINYGTLKFSNFVNCTSSLLVITNYGTLLFKNALVELTGEYGKVELSNNGNLQIENSTFDGNFGGTFSIISAVGDLTVTDSHFDISGSSQGKISELTVISSNSTWEKCTFTGVGGKIDYLNSGSLTYHNVQIHLSGFSNATIRNEDTLAMQGVNIQVYAGYMYIHNNGTLNAHNLYIKDQNDGTSLTNYKDAFFSESTFVANGATGKIEFFSSGNLLIHHGVFDGNYGGTLNINTATGSLNVSDSSFDVSGASHGKNSNLNIIGSNASWADCTFVNNAAQISYLNTGELELTNCAIQNVGTSTFTVLTSSGPMVFEKAQISGSGSISITCWEPSKLKDCTFNSSKSLTLFNNNELTVENWLVKTTDSTASISIFNTENSTLIFDKSFIEGVSVETLTAIGPKGQQFTEASGGTITVTNNGEMQVQSNPQPSPEPTPTPTTQTTPSPTQTPQTSPQGSPEPTQTSQATPEVTQTPQSTQNSIEGISDSNFISIIAIVAAIFIAVILILVVRKKQASKSK